MTEKSIEACKQHCPKYGFCDKMAERGMAHLLIAGSANSMVEYEDGSGNFVSSAESWGTADMSPEKIAEHGEIGKGLRDSGHKLQQSLLEGCTKGPLELRNDRYLCQSSVSSAIDFTEADL